MNPSASSEFPFVKSKQLSRAFSAMLNNDRRDGTARKKLLHSLKLTNGAFVLSGNISFVCLYNVPFTSS